VSKKEREEMPGKLLILLSVLGAVLFALLDYLLQTG